MDFPIKNCDFPQLCKRSPEGNGRVVPPFGGLKAGRPGASKVAGLDEEKTCKPGRACDELQRGLRKRLGRQFATGRERWTVSSGGTLKKK